VNDIAKLEEDLKEMKAMIEVEKEEHDTLMKEKEKEYEQTEEELTANNQEICMYTCHTLILSLLNILCL